MVDGHAVDQVLAGIFAYVLQRRQGVAKREALEHQSPLGGRRSVEVVRHPHDGLEALLGLGLIAVDAVELPQLVAPIVVLSEVQVSGGIFGVQVVRDGPVFGFFVRILGQLARHGAGQHLSAFGSSREPSDQVDS